MTTFIGSASIESLCLNVTSGGTPSRRNEEFWANGTIPWVKTGELKDCYIYDTEEKITEAGLLGSSAKVFPINTVLMAMYGDGKTITSLAIVKNEVATNQACCAMITDPAKCDYRYLYYALMHHRHRLLSLVVAGAQRNLSNGIIKRFKISTFSLITQQKIAYILSAYDDLIENNRRRIQLLEQAARLLYREWFVHLRFPGHEHVTITDGVPGGWEKKPFSELATFLNGFAFKPAHLGNVGLPIVKIPELRDGPTVKTPMNTGETIPEKYLLDNGDILFSWSGTLLVNIWNHGKGLLNQHLFKVTPVSVNLCGIVYFALKHALVEFQNQTTGATMKHIRKGALEKVTLLIPNAVLLDEFEATVAPMLEQISILQRQTTEAVKARDLLLPQLMNGEVAV